MERRNGKLRLLVLLPFALFPFSPFNLCRAQVVVDKTVATVNIGSLTVPDLITYSDLMWQLALQPNTQLEKPTSDDLNRALRLLEDQRLILQEAEKLPTIAPSTADVQKARDELARNFASAAVLQQRMERVGLTSEQLDDIVRDRVKIDNYVDFRFRAFVLITQQEITDYYNEVYAPRLRNSGRIVPPLDQVRSQIEHKLTEDKIESQIDTFIEGVRDRAEIIVLNPV